MDEYIVVLSYEIQCWNSAHSDFVAEMQNTSWNFEFDSKALPQSTCWRKYLVSTSQEAYRSSRDDFRKTEKQIKLKYPEFKAGSFNMIAFPINVSESTLFTP